MAAHPYWRIAISAVDGGTTIAIAEIEMHTSIGGADVCTGGTPSAYSVTGGAVANAFDGNTATIWGGAAATSTIGWIQYQFSTAQDIVEHVIVSANATPNRTPKNWTIQSSDDGVLWTTEAIIAGIAGWTTTQTQTFSHVDYPLSIGYIMPAALLAISSAIDTTVTNRCMPAPQAAVPLAQKMITGTVKENGANVARLVRAYRRLNSEFLGEVTSNAVTGAFSINARGNTDECYVIAFDDTGTAPDYNAQIFDLVMPI